DLQYIAGRGVVFERLFKINSARAQFTEEPRVFHRDHSLRREVLQQRDLLVGEGPNLVAVDLDRAENIVVLLQRHNQAATRTTEIDDGATAILTRLIQIRFL